jgi:hypothetical protein
MIKLAQAVEGGEGGGARPTPYTLFTITYTVAAERADTLPLLLLFP